MVHDDNKQAIDPIVITCIANDVIDLIVLYLSGGMYDMADDDDYDKTRRVSLTQAYRRPTDGRQPIANRRIGINNGNHPVYKVNHLFSSNQNNSSFSSSG